MLRISVKDKLGMHLLRSDKDCCFKCNDCGKEVDITEANAVDKVVMIPKCPDCKGEMKFKYWLDQLYTEEHYKKLLDKAREYYFDIHYSMGGMENPWKWSIQIGKTEQEAKKLFRERCKERDLEDIVIIGCTKQGEVKIGEEVR